jgi:endonuclease/exonuclease/phosphatase family metal-dependent hydrolase
MKRYRFRVGTLLGYIVLAVNAAFAFAFLLIAYSPYIHPAAHPVESCMGLAFPIFLIVNVLFVLFWAVAYWRYALLSMLAMLIGCGAIRTYIPLHGTTKELPEGAIKLLSYNTMQFGGLELTDEKNEVMEYLKNSGADIICLQEYSEGAKGQLTARMIFEQLKDYKYRDVHSVGMGGNRVALFSKFPIISASRVDYESNNNGSVVYDLRVGNDTVMLINNHLESNKLTQADKEMYHEMLTERNRETVESGTKYLLRKLADASAIRSHQADTIAALIERSQRKYIMVCGDFNDTPISYAHRRIGENLRDAFVSSGSGFGISYNRNRFYFRIDHILTSKSIKAYNCTVDHSIKASDHYPIWCYLTLNE